MTNDDVIFKALNLYFNEGKMTYTEYIDAINYINDLEQENKDLQRLVDIYEEL